MGKQLQIPRIPFVAFSSAGGYDHKAIVSHWSVYSLQNRGALGLLSSPMALVTLF